MATHSRGTMSLIIMVAAAPAALNSSASWAMSVLPTCVFLWIVCAGFSTLVADTSIPMPPHCKRMAFPKNARLQAEHSYFAKRLESLLRADHLRAAAALDQNAIVGGAQLVDADGDLGDMESGIRAATNDGKGHGAQAHHSSSSLVR